jgi:hypothetical protein
VVVPPVVPPASCRSDRQLNVSLTLAAPKGLTLKRTTVRVNGRLVRTLGRTTRFDLPLKGYPSGVAIVILKATTTNGTTLVGTRTYRLCGYNAKPAKRLTPLHRPGRG